MCISPVRIRNPNYHSNLSGAKYKDISSFYLNIPCGVCPQCISKKQQSFVQRVQMEQIDNHIFFCTLTYNDEMMPKIDTSTGYTIKYADVKDLQNMFKRLRKYNSFGRSFRYMYVSEMGSRSGRPHFHLLFLLPKHEDDTFETCLDLERTMFDAVLKNWSRNVGTNRKPVYKPCCTFIRRFVYGKLSSTFDLHYVNPSTTDNDVADVGFYVSKYMMKPSNRQIRLQQALHLNLPPDEYESVWNIVKPKLCCSHFFGLSSVRQIGYIRQCVKASYGDLYPKFFNPVNGKPFPLAHYYKTKGETFSLDDFLEFQLPDDFVYVSEDISTRQEEVHVLKDFSRRAKLAEENDSSFIFNQILSYGE